MTGDLAVTSRPAIAERSASAPLHRPRAVAVAASPSVAEPRSTNAPDRPGGEPPSAARLRALLADPTVQIRAHRDDPSARLVLQVLDRATGEVIEQYPPDQLLRFYAALRESLGALVDQCA
jgi:FlaG protein